MGIFIVFCKWPQHLQSVQIQARHKFWKLKWTARCSVINITAWLFCSLFAIVLHSWYVVLQPLTVCLYCLFCYFSEFACINKCKRKKWNTRNCIQEIGKLVLLLQITFDLISNNGVVWKPAILVCVHWTEWIYFFVLVSMRHSKKLKNSIMSTLAMMFALKCKHGKVVYLLLVLQAYKCPALEQYFLI